MKKTSIKIARVVLTYDEVLKALVDQKLIPAKTGDDTRCLGIDHLDTGVIQRIHTNRKFIFESREETE